MIRCMVTGQECQLYTWTDSLQLLPAYVKVVGSASPGTLGAWRWSLAIYIWQSEPPHSPTSFYNAGGWFVSSLQSKTSCLLVRSIQPSHPDCKNGRENTWMAWLNALDQQTPTLGAWRWSQLWQSEPPHRASYYNGGGWFLSSLQSTPLRCLLVRSIQPSHPGVVAFILQLGRRPKISGASQPQARYIVARRPPRGTARGLPSAIRLGTFQGNFLPAMGDHMTSF